MVPNCERACTQTEGRCDAKKFRAEIRRRNPNKNCKQCIVRECRESFVENQEKKTRKKMIRGRWDFGGLLIIRESGGGRGRAGAERVGEMGFLRSDGGSKVAHKTTNDIRRFASRKTFCSLGFLAPVDWISSFKFFYKKF